jgi:hypothetical protein
MSKPSPYVTSADLIASLAPSLDQRHVLGAILAQHGGFLDHLPPAALRVEIEIARAFLLEAGSGEGERLAQSFGL